MKRLLVYRLANAVCYVLLATLLIQLALWGFSGRYNLIALICTLLAALVAAAVCAFSLACPFCNRPLPRKAFRQAGTFPCGYCGKEIHIQ